MTASTSTSAAGTFVSSCHGRRMAGWQAGRGGCERRGEERKEAYLRSEAEFSRLRACEHACTPLALNSRWRKLEIGPSNLSRRRRNLKSTRHQCRSPRSEQSSNRRYQIARGTVGVCMLLLTEGGVGMAASHPTWRTMPKPDRTAAAPIDCSFSAPPSLLNGTPN